RRTAASIISRSASGSAILPNSDSTPQRRASQPSIWSVTPATPKTIAPAQLWPPSLTSTSATKTGIRISRPIVSRFGIAASGAGTARAAMLKGYGGGRAAHASGVRERPQPRVPAGPAGSNRGWRLLGLAGVHAGRGLTPGTGTGPEELRRRLSRAARRRLYGRRRVPLPGARGGSCGRRGRGGGGDRVRPAVCGVRPRRDRT